VSRKKYIPIQNGKERLLLEKTHLNKDVKNKYIEVIRQKQEGKITKEEYKEKLKVLFNMK
jgi:hypothetical protein